MTPEYAEAYHVSMLIPYMKAFLNSKLENRKLCADNLLYGQNIGLLPPVNEMTSYEMHLNLVVTDSKMSAT